MWTITELEGNQVQFAIAGEQPRTIVVNKADWVVVDEDPVVVIRDPQIPSIIKFRLRTFEVADVVLISGGAQEPEDYEGLLSAIQSAFTVTAAAAGGASFPQQINEALYPEETGGLSLKLGSNFCNAALTFHTGGGEGEASGKVRVRVSDYLPTVESDSAEDNTYEWAISLSPIVQGVDTFYADPFDAYLEFTGADVGQQVLNIGVQGVESGTFNQITAGVIVLDENANHQAP